MPLVSVKVWRYIKLAVHDGKTKTWRLAQKGAEALTVIHELAPDTTDNGMNAIIDPTQDTEEFLEKVESYEQLHNALAQLPETYKNIIEEYYYQDKSVEEIALDKDIPENTVKTRLVRARKRLKEILEGTKI